MASFEKTDCLENVKPTELPPEGRVAAMIVKHQSDFMTYNIGRIRELIRYLTPKKNRLFQLIPFWLHVNAPNMPGYLNHSGLPFGIYRFHESGFYKQALALQNLSAKTIRPFLPKRDAILGVYLMGSAGTLAQTRKSDFDYWILVDGDALGNRRMGLLQKKLSLVEAHCKTRYQQAVSFFILDKQQARANNFGVLDEESAGSSQKVLLKEEFYRTFIMIAGKIPFWVVVPPGLTDKGYRQWICLSKKECHLRLIPEDYIDLGHLTGFDAKEALGALLWQIYKLRNSPAKSFIKAALIAYYVFFFETEGFLCDQIKERFLKGTDTAHLIDPYLIMFDKAQALIESLGDKRMLELIRKCIFLRLSGYQAVCYQEEKSPKEVMLHQMVQTWQWEKEAIDRLLQYGQWPESEKLQFEKTVFSAMSFLYEIVMRSLGDEMSSPVMADGDLKRLTRQIDVCFKPFPGKIPRCSAYLKANADKYRFIVFGQEGSTEGQWSVFGRVGTPALDTQSFLFKGPELLRVAGWLLFNHLHTAMHSAITLQHGVGCPVSGSQAQRTLKRVFRFFEDSMGRTPLADTPACWSRALVLWHSKRIKDQNPFEKTDFLVMNSLGSFYYDTLSLGKIETQAAACYSVAEHIWVLMRQVQDFKMPYRVIFWGPREVPGVAEAIDENIAHFIRNKVQLDELKKLRPEK